MARGHAPSAGNEVTRGAQSIDPEGAIRSIVRSINGYCVNLNFVKAFHTLHLDSRILRGFADLGHLRKDNCIQLSPVTVYSYPTQLYWGCISTLHSGCPSARAP